ncbi:ethanolamine ammonia-lyase subunit EutC [Marinobacter panjinensis]|uniref:Ethanolamine ammonia-lyase small subunit n=1 Tax=Marinobacter panjinensis TaxID=2576384 RepID=A0A4U6QVY9_9GAMM|nr:ethanolamine ammonia-lyase subunit EutC [Marinobacter panjinensis]MCR8915188.1 ethanolamine ammonia-lyase subunit EutC [Marinobacter panjinensis]TKV64412.1 ethanolamine ammonia-lyase subunit EutC [Marinobacter panjinensis]
MSEERPLVTGNVWRVLRQFTDARIGLGRAGISLPTHELLKFQLAHARARDAVHFPLDVKRLVENLNASPAALPGESPLLLKSQAQDRLTYLQRPDLGRELSQESVQQLARHRVRDQSEPVVAIVIVDGLSSSAIQNSAEPMVTQLLRDLGEDPGDWRLAPLSIVEQGRVAIGDEIGECLGASVVVVLIGERPGLSSPDSLGMYLTWGPERGLSDARRNCISNVRPGGLSFEQASQRLRHLMEEARRLRISGISLKDRTDEVVIETTANSTTFLTD